MPFGSCGVGLLYAFLARGSGSSEMLVDGRWSRNFKEDRNIQLV